MEKYCENCKKNTNILICHLIMSYKLVGNVLNWNPCIVCETVHWNSIRAHWSQFQIEWNMNILISKLIFGFDWFWLALNLIVSICFSKSFLTRWRFYCKILDILNHILILIALEFKSLQKIPEIEFNEMLCYASNESSCVLAIKEFCRYTQKKLQCRLNE